jgi:hypothetical protein
VPGVQFQPASIVPLLKAQLELGDPLNQTSVGRIITDAGHYSRGLLDLALELVESSFL